MIISWACEEMVEILLLCFNIISKEHIIFNKTKKKKATKSQVPQTGDISKELLTVNTKSWQVIHTIKKLGLLAL